MDDPLSAVDAHVSKHIFDNLIGPKGYLNDRTRILVTHSLGVLHKVDRILLFHDGRIVDQGTLAELQAKKSEYFQQMEKFVGKEEIEEMPKLAELHMLHDRLLFLILQLFVSPQVLQTKRKIFQSQFFPQQQSVLLS